MQTNNNYSQFLMMVIMWMMNMIVIVIRMILMLMRVMMLMMVRQSAQLGDVRMFRGMLIPDQVQASCTQTDRQRQLLLALALLSRHPADSFCV